MKVTISPGKAEGIMAAPPSKSMAHRLLICAGLAKGSSTIYNVDPSEDILATIDCLNALGAKAEYKDGVVTVKGTDARESEGGVELPCRECGSTLRFFIPICLLSRGVKRLTGSEKLLSRPLNVYKDICAGQGLHYAKSEQGVFAGGILAAGTFEVPGNISSQFISGLLFALPLLENDSEIKILPPFESRPYIDMTINALKTYGVEVSWKDELTIDVPGNQSYKAKDATVEGDFSNAAYLESFNLAGGKVSLTGLDELSAQGDKVYKEFFKTLNEGYANIDITDCPDLAPVLMAGAAVNFGAHFTGTARLRLKESDRGLAMREELAKLGIRAAVMENEIVVESGHLLKGQTLSGHNDHRIVMALAFLLSIAGGSITEAESVKKSLPDFFTRIQKLGIGVTSDELDK
jgi:3-phosphoshikimate 1-carboxyvinyltransferase